MSLKIPWRLHRHPMEFNVYAIAAPQLNRIPERFNGDSIKVPSRLNKDFIEVLSDMLKGLYGHSEAIP